MSFNLTNVIFNPLSILDSNSGRSMLAIPSPAVERQPSARDAYRTGFSDGYQTGAADAGSQNDWGTFDNAPRRPMHGHDHGGRRDAGRDNGGYHNHRHSESGGNGYGSGYGGSFGNRGSLGYGSNTGYIDPYFGNGYGSGYGNGMSANNRQRPGGQDAYGHGYGSDRYANGYSRGSSDVDGSYGAQRPSSLNASGTGKDAVVTTQSGYKIQVTSGAADAGGQVVITAPNGKTTKLWGDPHVETSNGQKFDFKSTLEALLGNNPREKIEFKTKPGPNNTTVIDSISVIDKQTNDGVRVSGVSSGGDLQINRGNGKRLDALLADGTKTYFNVDGNGAYTTNNGFGGVDQVIDQGWLNSQEANIAAGNNQQPNSWGGHSHYRTDNSSF